MDYFWTFFHRASKKPIHGYLAITINADSLLTKVTSRLREEFKFLPMELADPPRERGVLHVTIAMFKKGLTEDELESLRSAFKDQHVELRVTGYGKAVNHDSQALYLSVDAPEIADFRNTISRLGLQFLAPDPHITFGVHELTRKDVHGVPKLKHFDLEPFTLQGTVHFKSGPYVLF